MDSTLASVTDKPGVLMAGLAGDNCDHPITINKDGTVGLPISAGLGIGGSDAKIESHRAPEIAV